MTRARDIAAVGSAFLSRPALCKRWDISRATSYKMQKDGYLTAPVKLGPGIARWPLAEIEKIEEQAAADRGAP